jgi:hypothetical protein
MPRPKNTQVLVTIYALIDPRDSAVRYIGATNNINRRLSDHLKDTPKYDHYNARWIRSLLSAGLEPKLRILEWVSPERDWAEQEKRWTAIYKADGASLTNGSEGGKGVVAMSEEARAKLRDAWANKTPEEQSVHIARMNNPTTNAKKSVSAKRR